ncbi:epidermal growth factor-like protein 7 [Hyperolius riggenbachi]|uniref:epidermal growth factor-like protein 7 n=1 Tax=Hyperolius riggenbachi TaxID=752182 RepID=UPI0035A3C25B
MAAILEVSVAEYFYRTGRRICSSGSPTEVVSAAQSFIQPVYQPLMTLCEGQRVCSTYRTTYKMAYRQVTRMAPVPLYSCCPGWNRIDTYLPNCNRASCSSPCLHGGTCAGYNKCRCPPGWMGNLCQTDVDECTAGRHRCAQNCLNAPGTFHCACREGFRLNSDGRSCDKEERPAVTQQPPPPQPEGNNTAGVPDSVREEMQELRNKIEVLEQKLQLVLAPFHSLSTSSPEDSQAPISLLTHSFQQLDRIDSLSEQISFLEERLETCSCKNEV